MEILLDGIILHKIHEMPLLDRPREKASRYGINSLSDDELIALLIGFGGVDNSALDIAKTMLFDCGGLYNLANKSIEQFKMYKGIKDVKALTLVAIFEIAKRYNTKRIENSEYIIDSEYLYKKYENRLRNNGQETFIIIILNKQKKIVHEMELYKGSNRRITVSFHDIFKVIMMHDGYYFFVVHNHPDSDSQPSKEDVLFTRELLNRCAKMEIVLLDHLIIGKEGYYSFLKENYFKNAKNVAY